MTVTIDQNKRQKASKTVKEDLGQDHVGGVGEGEAKGEEGEAEKVALSEKKKNIMDQNKHEQRYQHHLTLWEWGDKKQREEQGEG